jgi:hypothetical protein
LPNPAGARIGAENSNGSKPDQRSRNSEQLRHTARCYAELLDRRRSVAHPPEAGVRTARGSSLPSADPSLASGLGECHLAAPPKEPRPDGRRTGSRDLGDLIHRKVLPVAQHDGCTLVRLQAVKQPPYLGFSLALQESGFRTWVGPGQGLVPEGQPRQARLSA